MLRKKYFSWKIDEFAKSVDRVFGEQHILCLHNMLKNLEIYGNQAKKVSICHTSRYI